MSVQAILAPVFVLVLLTFVLLLRTAAMRTSLVRRGRVRPEAVTLDSAGYPPRVRQFGNAYANQFELPILFYVLAIAFWALDAVNVLVLVAAWLFVGSRIAHAWVHLTSNYIPNRRRLFTVGWWVLAFMVLLAIYVLIGRI